jgi:cell division protein FtsB
MEISTDYLFKVIGIERTSRQVAEEENNILRANIKKLEEEKSAIQKAVKKQTEDV